MAALTDKASGNGESLFANQKIVWVGKGDELSETNPAPPKPVSITGIIKNFLLGTKAPPSRGTDRLKLPSSVSDKYEIVPVTIDPATNEKYYGGFCNDCLWPLFHYFPSQVVLDESYFDSYITANTLFAEKVQSIIEPGDFVWIHDYQLFLLPLLLRKKVPSANIGFFLHIPFPTFELFRILPHRWREAILNGILGADLVGFHTYDYSQYFLRTVSRLLGYETTMNSVQTEESLVRVDSFPIGIDFEKYQSAATQSGEVEQERNTLKKMLKNQKLIFSVDRLDYSKGLLQRLEAFECFLETYPEWLEKIVFNMVVIPSRENIPEYQRMKREIEAVVGNINGKYSTIAWRPVIYQYKTLSFNELVALYDLSLVGLITPIRDGMNLVAKEYVACQVTEKGVLVLSEMAGAAAELGEALLINPTDKRDVAEAINKALLMPLRERIIRNSRMQKRIRTYTVFAWARDMIDGLLLIKKEQVQRKVNLITPAIAAAVLARYMAAGRRAIFIDYDGTLVPFAKVPELAIPDAHALMQLKTLAGNSANAVVLISGRDKNFLEEWFGSVNVHLVAEHGAFQKSPGGEWQSAIDADQGWKATFLPVLQRYADHCNGSFIEDKFSSLSWHFRNAPPEIGFPKANELKEELRTLVSHESKLQVLDGNMVVEIKRTGYDKGIAASKFVAATAYDFVLAFGDDKTDEDLFRALPPDAITIKVGMSQSLAQYNLTSQKEVSRFIGHMIAQDRLPES
jgi:trehalose 6-phosphate synthase/phosphatase